MGDPMSGQLNDPPNCARSEDCSKGQQHRRRAPNIGFGDSDPPNQFTLAYIPSVVQHLLDVEWHSTRLRHLAGGAELDKDRHDEPSDE